MHHVLYVDDEPALCKAFERALRNRGLHIVTTTSSPEAIQLIASGRFDVVATDYRMPEIDGLAVLREARLKLPGARRVLVSGQADTEIDPAGLVEAAVDEIVPKPWSLDDLRRVLVGHAAAGAEQWAALTAAAVAG